MNAPHSKPLDLAQFEGHMPRKVRWQVRIPQGAWMCGIHTFRSRTEAKEFISRWLKADANTSICDLRPTLLRNGVPS